QLQRRSADSPGGAHRPADPGATCVAWLRRLAGDGRVRVEEPMNRRREPVQLRRRMRAGAWVGLAALVGTLVGLRSGVAEDAKVPADLARVPPESAGFVSVRVADLWSHPALAAVTARLQKDDPKAVPEVVAALGVEPGEIERVTF